MPPKAVATVCSSSKLRNPCWCSDNNKNLEADRAMIVCACSVKKSTVVTVLAKKAQPCQLANPLDRHITWHACVHMPHPGRMCPPRHAGGPIRQSY